MYLNSCKTMALVTKIIELIERILREQTTMQSGTECDRLKNKNNTNENK